VAVLAGGCFWGVEGVFEHVKGVLDVVSGYAGGKSGDASYERVASEETRPAEAVRIVYDPKLISFGTLLRIFFAMHDPTELNRQGPDVGPSYRSAIFPQNESQRRVAVAYIRQLNTAHSYREPLTTQVESGRFHPAEAAHQDFLRLNPRSACIMRWDMPKIAALKADFPTLYLD
jgi:peptide-methionine (S)-S-oxide reductase